MNGKPGKRILQSTICSLSHADTLEDLLKGSYYANPVADKPTVSSTLRAMYPEYYGNNICKFRVYASSKDVCP